MGPNREAKQDRSFWDDEIGGEPVPEGPEQPGPGRKARGSWGSRGPRQCARREEQGRGPEGQGGGQEEPEARRGKLEWQGPERGARESQGPGTEVMRLTREGGEGTQGPRGDRSQGGQEEPEARRGESVPKGRVGEGSSGKLIDEGRRDYCHSCRRCCRHSPLSVKEGEGKRKREEERRGEAGWDEEEG